ncbi:MAG: hypothetical protein PHD78_03325 [Bacilli bacterium]|nr:hypothetical protein [Bacilli bacterium]MDD4053885.1 hypothetical protein [Bacilli bacterium]MDD4411025.1 hypothetical protein [Bacilli bacterium]
MRESVGATFLIKIMVVFIVLYNSMLAIAVNYAMVFRVKNQIINLLEQYEGCVGARNNIEAYINSVGYYRAVSDEGPYSIEPINIPGRGTYYRVTTYIEFDFPIVNRIFHVDISGETKIIYGVNENSAQCNAVGH